MFPFRLFCLPNALLYCSTSMAMTIVTRSHVFISYLLILTSDVQDCGDQAAHVEAFCSGCWVAAFSQQKDLLRGLKGTGPRTPLLGHFASVVLHQCAGDCWCCFTYRMSKQTEPKRNTPLFRKVEIFIFTHLPQGLE